MLLGVLVRRPPRRSNRCSSPLYARRYTVAIAVVARPTNDRAADTTARRAACSRDLRWRGSSAGPGGGTGIRSRLKIDGPAEGMWVRIPPRASRESAGRAAPLARADRVAPDGRPSPRRAPQEPTETFHGGRLIARRLKAHGVSKLFTLSGGHLFSIYDGCREEGIEIVDVRHESTAAFAAEGWAKVTREPGVCALTAGPGRDERDERDGLGAGQPLADGRARRPRAGAALGAGLAAGDRPRAVRAAADASSRRRRESTAEIPGLVDEAFAAALRAARRARRSWTSRWTTCSWRRAEPEDAPSRRGRRGASRGAPTARRSNAPPSCCAGAERPVIMAGTDLYWGHGEQALLELAETLRIPVFLNGLARGCVPADHELFFSRARSQALKGADVALVIGVPMDFRLGFGGVVRRGHRDRRDRRRPSPSAATRGRSRPSCYGALAQTLARPARGRRRRRRCASERWIARAARGRDRAARRPSGPSSRTTARRCTRCGCTRSSAEVLDRDAIVIGDGGDFVSYAGRVIDSYQPGCWLDPGPFGCLGTGPGLRAGGEARAPRAPGRAAARRRRLRLLGHGVRHARAPRRERRRRDGQQRHLGAREAPDGVPLRLLGGRRAAPRDALRPGRRGARRPRRAGRAPAGRARRRSSARSRRAGRRWSTC